jgi:RP/EB family microtubule-associated protein
MSGDSIGMMEGAFFVSRSDILDWLNDLLGLSLTKVEQCATGAVYCGVIDAIYPGSFGFSKVNWGAKHEYEFVNNYKVL